MDEDETIIICELQCLGDFIEYEDGTILKDESYIMSDT